MLFFHFPTPSVPRRTRSVVRGRRRLFAGTLAVALALPFPAQAGKIDRASNEASGRGGGDEHQKSSSSRSNRAGSGAPKHVELEDDDQAALALVLTYYVLLSPFSIPHTVAHHEGAPERVMALRPYETPKCGLYCALRPPFDASPRQTDEEGAATGDSGVPTGPGRSRDKPVAFFFGIEGGIDPAPMPLFALDLRATTLMGLGLSTRLMGFREQAGGDVDLALLGKSHLLYRFATTSHVQFRAGLGARYFSAAEGTRAGFDFLYAFDIQWAKPVFSNFEFGLGMVGAAFAPEVRGTLGMYLGKAQLYLGWDQNWIGGVPLGGAILGVGGVF